MSDQSESENDENLEVMNQWLDFFLLMLEFHHRMLLSMQLIFPNSAFQWINPSLLN